MPKDLLEFLVDYVAAIWKSLDLVDKLVLLGLTVFVVAITIAERLTKF